MPNEKSMDIVQHLEEFRHRLIISLLGVGVTSVLAYVFSDAILHLLTLPAGGIQLFAFSPMDGFMIRFRVAFYGGLVLAAPLWIYQLWCYVAPALSPSESRLVIPSILVTAFLFGLGNLFGYVMLGRMMGVLFAMFGTGLEYLPSAGQYISFVVYFLLATGIAFELPVVLLLLMRLGLVTPQALRRQRRLFYFVIFVFAELIVPAVDPIVAPMVVMLPMIVLFELALVASRFILPKAAAVPVLQG